MNKLRPERQHGRSDLYQSLREQKKKLSKLPDSMTTVFCLLENLSHLSASSPGIKQYVWCGCRAVSGILFPKHFILASVLRTLPKSVQSTRRAECLSRCRSHLPQNSRHTDSDSASRAAGRPGRSSQRDFNVSPFYSWLLP